MNPLRIFLLAALVLVVFGVNDAEAEEADAILEQVGRYDTDSQVDNVYISGDFAYLAAREEGIIILNIEDPTNPIFVGSYETSNARGVIVYGNYAYVADYDNGLVILNIEDPTNPTFIGSNDTYINCMDLIISENYAYIAANDNGLIIVNIEDPVNPIFVGIYERNSGQYFYDVSISENYAYVAAAGISGQAGFIIINIEDPTNPIFAAHYKTEGYVYGVDISGDYAYLADWYSLVVLNIEDPANPTFAGSYDLNMSEVNEVYISSNYAYVTGEDSGLVVLNIDNPNNSTIVGSYETVDMAVDIYVSGNYAYVADRNNGLVIIKTVYNHPPKITDITPTSGSDGQYLVFEVNIFDEDDDELVINWTMGDGTSYENAGAEVLHIFTDDGEYNVTITAYDGMSTATITYYITVNNVPPTLSVFYDALGNEGDIASFNAQVSDVPSDEVTVTWTFPDGTTVESVFSQYTFTDDGDFIVLVTASDEDGGQVSEQFTVIIENVAPIFTEFALSSQVKQYIEANFSVGASDPGDDTIVYNVDFGDGTSPLTTPDGGNISHKFAEGDTFTVRICATDEDGGETCREQVLPVTIFELPTAIAGSDMTVKPGDTVQFNGAGTSDDDGVIVLYEWDFDGDGIYELSSEDNGRTTNIYNIEGEYNPTLRVTDNIGHTASNSFKVTVKEDPETEDPETEDPETEDPETEDPGLPSISLLTSLISIGLLAIFRRK